MTPSDLHSAWARLFVASLAGSGVHDVVVSPGSRSTPLVLAIAAEPRLRVTVVIDERSAGFVALGIGRATARPACLVCTSGTAGAHYLPAVIEASESEVPLLVVTADRPWELQGCGAAQTINQRRLFGAFVRHDATLGEPFAGDAALRAVPRIAAFAVARSLGPVPGPVHVDAAFRKPLEPVTAAGGEPWAEEVERLRAAGPPVVRTGRARPSDEAVADLVEIARASRSTVIVAGPCRPADRARLPEAVAAFARAARAPVIAEMTSGLRFAPGVGAVAAGPDELLGSETLRHHMATELLVEIGAPPVSAAWGRLAAHPGVARVVLGAPHLADPHGTARLVIEGDVADALLRAAARLMEIDDDEAATARARVATTFDSAARAAGACVVRALAACPWSEGTVARAVIDALPAGAVLLAGNSGVARELDAWAGSATRPIEVHHQRGAAGIDGLVAGAVGARIATPPDRPVAALLGDVAAVHDLGSLVVARGIAAPLVIVVVHNDGGRIFEQLPVAGRPELSDALEQLFVTPHGVSLAAVAGALGLRASRVSTIDALRAALAEAVATPRATIIEAVVPSSDAGPRRRALGASIDRAIAEALA